MWEVKDIFANRKRFRQYAKKHFNEFASCFKNLDRLRAALEDGMTLQQCSFGFFGSEGKDVYRIGQSGIPNAHETRLYIYVEIAGTEIYLLTIGDKNTQSLDIEWCHTIVEQIRKRKTNENEGQN